MQEQPQQPQASVRLERASLEFQNLTIGRATWASRPVFPEKEKQKVESPPFDHDSNLGESLPPFHQKTLETHSQEDLLDQRFRKMNQQIEELIRLGRLDRFIQHRPEGRKDRPRALPRSELPKGEE